MNVIFEVVMVVVACSGCNEEVSVQDDKMKHLKIHMLSAHNFNGSIESHASPFVKPERSSPGCLTRQNIGG